MYHSSNIMQQIIIKKATCEAGLFDKKFYIISEKSWFQLEIHSQSWVTWYIKRWPIGCILSNWHQNPTQIQGQQIGTSRGGLEIKIQHFVCFLGNFTSVWKCSCCKVIFGKSGAGYSSPSQPHLTLPSLQLVYGDIKLANATSKHEHALYFKPCVAWTHVRKDQTALSLVVKTRSWFGIYAGNLKKLKSHWGWANHEKKHFSLE